MRIHTHVAVVVHEDGTSAILAVSEPTLKIRLAKWVRMYWKDGMGIWNDGEGNAKPSGNDQEDIDSYFNENDKAWLYYTESILDIKLLDP